jgi:hypothetical protein
MPLSAPRLDERTFEQLLAEARARIPQFTPEWTNFNDSDPGMTLVQLHAWLTETLLVQLNQVPDLNYLKFLDLLNVRPRPDRPAAAELSFRLKKLNLPRDPLLVLVPQRTRVAVDDPSLPQELLFETDRTLRAVNAAIGIVTVPKPPDPESANTRLQVTTFDDDGRSAVIPSAFSVFGPAPAAGALFQVGLLLRPHRRDDEDYSLDRFPAGELDLTVFVPQVGDADAEGRVVEGPPAHVCRFPWEQQQAAAGIAWEVYTGTQHRTDFDRDDAWVQVDAQDGTSGLTRSGHVVLELPANLPEAGFTDLAADVWAELGLSKPPFSRDELLAVLGDTLPPADLTLEQWAALGIPEPDLGDLARLREQIRTANLTMDGVSPEEWQELGFDLPPVPYRLVWLRARLRAVPERAPQISLLALNTVGATAAVTVSEEILGDSSGRPDQTFRLRRSPVVLDEATGEPELAVEVVTLGTAEPWRVVDDFFGAGPADPVFTLEPATGTLRSGDGVHGRIPVAGGQVVARRYRVGGGAAGNAGPGTVTNLRGALFEVDGVTNHRAAAGGRDAESLDEVRLRAPHDLRTRDRAVTSDDFAELALRTPGVPIHRAFALPLTRLDQSVDPPALVPDSPGAVTVVVLPESGAVRPQPTEDHLRLVCAHLDRRRLITTELYVRGPDYLELSALRAEVTAARDADLRAVHDDVTARLLDYFHPLRGGEDGRGWPFGRDIFLGAVYRQVLGVPGVRHVRCLEVVAGQPLEADDCDDVVPVPDGSLVFLPRTAVDLEVRHDRDG